MITIQNQIVKKQPNFWSHCLFHPTDAVEDPWGKRILDRMSADHSIRTIRIYAMLEDIVYRDGEGNLQYDFRLNDLRLDYLISCGYDLLIAYTAMPDCIAASTHCRTSHSKNKTRYKGKMFNTSAPSDYALWEEICYQYTKHLVDRYGLEQVLKWHLHCWNEPDLDGFLLSELRGATPENQQKRLEVYCKMYERFVHALDCVSDQLHIGGPALAMDFDFLKGFLNFVRENNLHLDYIALHNYGTSPRELHDGSRPLTVANNIQKQATYMQIINDCGLGDREVILDEWGASNLGYFNMEEAPELLFRETEVFSAYYAKLIHEIIRSEFPISQMEICLSGQHEMTEDFSGFRNFFTMNFIAKPIYNAYVMGSRLYENLLSASGVGENTFLVPTKNDQGDYSVLISYASEYFEENIPARTETVSFETPVTGKTVTVYCIDRNTTNPYRLAEKEKIGKEPTDEQIRQLREEGKLKPVQQFVATQAENSVTLNLTPNSTFLITVQ